MSEPLTRNSSPAATPPARAQRRDATRNRARILTAAAAAFARDGFSAPIDEIARAAGVGAGTIYRAFPNKELLLAKVINAVLVPLLADAQALARNPDPEAFFALFTRIAESCALRQHLALALTTAAVDLPATTYQCLHETQAILADLFVRSQTAGVIRADCSPDDIEAVLVGCVAMIQRRADPAATHRLISIVTAGFRAPPAGAPRSDAD